MNRCAPQLLRQFSELKMKTVE